MAEWGWIAIPLAIGVWDMHVNHCPTGCLAPARSTPRTEFSLGPVFLRDEFEGFEAYLRYATGQRRGPFGLAYGISVTDSGAVWAGAGISYTPELPTDGVFVQFHVMPGLYFEDDGPEIGGPLETRAGVEIGYEARSGLRYTLSLDHRSNGGLYDRNPGIVTIQFRVSVPIR